MLDYDGAPVTIIIGCGRKKLSRSAPAREVYSSDRIRSSVEVAQTLGAKYFIASAKHGLIAPHRVIAPYDVDLSAATAEDKEQWGTKVISDLRIATNSTSILLLADTVYSDAIEAGNRGLSSPFAIRSPLKHINHNAYASWFEASLRDARRIRFLAYLKQVLAPTLAPGDVVVLDNLPAHSMQYGGVRWAPAR